MSPEHVKTESIPEKNPVIDIVKGIAILLVVYGHVIQRTMGANGADYFLNPAFRVIYTFHMPLFFFLSGFLLSGSLQRRSAPEVLQSKFRSLIIPFFAWGILEIITFYFLSIADGKSSVGLMTLFDQAFIHPTLWFLPTLFVLSSLVILAARWQKRFGPVTFILILCVLLILPFKDYFSLYYIQWFYLFFAGGYLVHKHEIYFKHPRIELFLTVVSAAVFIKLLSFWTKGDYIYVNKMRDIFGRAEFFGLIYRYVLGFLGIFLAWIAGTYLSKTKLGPVLGFAGIYSLDIYLVQRYVVEGIYPRMISKLQVNLDFNSPLFIYLFVPAAAVFFVAICILISNFLIRKNKLLNRLLLGGRY